MHPSAATTTPFSVKDILRLDCHSDCGNYVFMADQVVQTQPHQNARAGDFHACQSEQCVSGVQMKLGLHKSDAEEEMNAKGEMMRD